MPKRDSAPQSTLPLDEWIPNPDVKEHVHTIVRAPAGLTMDVASEFDLQSMVPVRTIFWLRERIMRVSSTSPRKREGLWADTKAMGRDRISMNSDFKDLLRLLSENEVEFLVVGGYAVMMYTEPRYTKDLDIVISRSPENTARVISALFRQKLQQDARRTLSMRGP